MKVYVLICGSEDSIFTSRALAEDAAVSIEDGTYFIEEWELDVLGRVSVL